MKSSPLKLSTALSLVIAASFCLPGLAPAALAETVAPPAATPAKTESETAKPDKSSPKMPFEADLDKINDKEPYVIKNVTVSGNKLIPRGQIKAQIKVKSGDFYSRAETEKDLKAVYKMGYFSREDLHVNAEMTSAGMVLNISVKENPLVKSFIFQGSQLLPENQLQSLFRDQLQKPENKRDERAAIKTIISEYHKKGLLLASADAVMGTVDEYGDTKNVGKVTVTIHEGVLDKVEIVCPTEEDRPLIEKALTFKNGEAYNENIVAADLSNAFKVGKFTNINREVLPTEKSGHYVLKVIAIREEKIDKKTQAHSLLSPKKSQALPVLNKYIKTPMYKNIKGAR